MKMKMNAVLSLIALSATASGAPTMTTYKGKSKTDGSPCVVSLYKENKKVVAFAAKGHGRSHMDGFYLSPESDSIEVAISPDDNGSMSILSDTPIEFHASNHFFSKGVTYSLRIYKSLEGIKIGTVAALSLNGNENSPTDISISYKSIGLPNGYQKMSCVIEN